jgi:hypothetical protein
MPFPNPPLAPEDIAPGQALKLSDDGQSWVAFTPGEGGGVSDMGTVTVSVDILDTSDLDLDAEVAPYSKSQTPANLVAHAPEYASDFLPLTALAPGGQLVVSYLCTFLDDLWADVDLEGSIVAWDQAGDNLLSASFIVNGIVAGDDVMGLTQIQLIGTDLSIGDDGQSILTAAGGSYNIRIKAYATWDD